MFPNFSHSLTHRVFFPYKLVKLGLKAIGVKEASGEAEIGFNGLVVADGSVSDIKIGESLGRFQVPKAFFFKFFIPLLL